MGIPSFYRHLCRSHPTIITSKIVRPAWLCLDFNCAMYHVLHKMEPGSDKIWEGKFRKAICAYLEEIVDLVLPTAGVYVSCDGVVCAAKRRQQRLRRFKGPYLTPSEGWDQNALTPGSAFMASLAKDLIKKGASLQKSLSVPVIVSTTEEPGEGEHKLMAHMRSIQSSCMIYGLDADLMLLAMLLVSEKGEPVHLLREAQEFEQGGAGWRTVDIEALQAALLPDSPVPREKQTDDFVAAMSLLGNDFLPKSLSYTVRDDGIPKLIRILEQLWSQGKTLVNGSIDQDNLHFIIRQFASHEEEALVSACLNAVRQRTRANDRDSLPAQWATILQLYGGSRTLKPGWRSIYAGWREETTAEEYLAGVAWVFDYYKGRPVDLGWHYDHHLPPLWSDFAGSNISPPPLVYTTYLPAWIHLLAVLPEKSAIHLLKKSQLGLLKTHPLYWPTQFSLFDIGASQLWQTEAVIPIIPEELLRKLDGATPIKSN
jgi:5'-3' exonuclease